MEAVRSKTIFVNERVIFAYDVNQLLRVLNFSKKSRRYDDNEDKVGTNNIGLLLYIRITWTKVIKNLLNHKSQSEVSGSCQYYVKVLLHRFVFEHQYWEDAVQCQNGLDRKKIEHPMCLDEYLEGVQDRHHHADTPFYVPVPIDQLQRIVARDFFVS